MAKSVETRIKEKFDKTYGISPKPPQAEEKDPVKASLSKKLNAYTARLNGYNSMERAKAYMGKPISEIVREQRKAENRLEAAEENLEKFLDGERKKAVKRYKSGTEDAKSKAAEEYIKYYVIGSYAYESREPDAYAAHKKYEELNEAVTEARIEKNALSVAQQDFEDVNKDLFEELRKEAVIADIKKSGILKKIGIQAEEPQEAEEQEAGESKTEAAKPSVNSQMWNEK